MHKKQVEPTHYINSDYDIKERFISYWHQIHEIKKCNPKKILEIGVGNRFVSDYLKQRHFNVTTVDFDKDLSPDIVADICDLPLDQNSFDVVVCFEVLEHIPYLDALKGISELQRVSSRWVLVSLPDCHRYFHIDLNLPFIGRHRKLIKSPQQDAHAHIFDGQHYWEIGKKNYDLNKIIQDFESKGLQLHSTYPLFEHTYHRFFIFEKK